MQAKRVTQNDAALGKYFEELSEQLIEVKIETLEDRKIFEI